MVSQQLEYFIQRRQDLERQKQNAWEVYHAVNGAIQECDTSIRVLTQLEPKAAQPVKPAPKKPAQQATKLLGKPAPAKGGSS